MLADWLLHTGSLTERIQASSSDFQVQLLGQASVPLQDDEQQALPSYSAHAWQVREVLLLADHRPWVYARSVLPSALCDSRFQQLGNQPLGQRIFNDDAFVRSEFTLAKVHIDEANLYARRSRFCLQQYDLLVAEVFLPDCPCYQT